MNVRKVVKKAIPSSLFQKIEPMGHLTEAVSFNAAYKFPSKGMKVIGVTGTNGKTSTCFLIHRMLTEAGYKVGLLTTVAYGIGNDIRPQIHHMTNVPVPELMKRLTWMKKQKIDWLVFETTSQGLAQHRVWGVPYSMAVMTNVTHEHLDYHKTFERYVAAKRMLFEIVAKNKKGLNVGIGNADDPNGANFANLTKNPVLYGVKDGDVKAENIKLHPSGVEYDAVAKGETYHIKSHLPGSFNVYNTLAAVCAGRALGLSKEQIEKGINFLEGVEGRMNTISEGQDFNVIVDFAHTPDSFEILFKDMRPVVKGKMIVLFGSPGRRDEAKRAIQGRLAGKYADEVIITEEDDRDIDGIGIMNQIAEGTESAGKIKDKNLFLIHDRTEAIKFALSRAKSKDDTVLLLGKGHEKTMEKADGEHPWDEIATARKALNDLLSSKH